MIDWYLMSRAMLYALHEKAVDALRHCEKDEAATAKTLATYMRADFQRLYDHWHSMFPEEDFGNLRRHIAWAEESDFNDILKRDLPAVEKKLDQHLIDFKKSLSGSKADPYVAEERLTEIAQIQSKRFDTAKLICLLREINAAYNSDCHLAIGMLVRATIDHVPPIFGFDTFAEVSNNYKGTKSFKRILKRLNDSLRNLADSYLHVQIRKVESLPTFNQVDFRAELDALLGEVSRVLQEA